MADGGLECTISGFGGLEGVGEIEEGGENAGEGEDQDGKEVEIGVDEGAAGEIEFFFEGWGLFDCALL